MNQIPDQPHAPSERADAPPVLWHRPGWMRAPLLALAWAGLLVYGSLLPWRFDLGAIQPGDGHLLSALAAWITSPGWVPAVMESSSLGVPHWASDLITNLLIYGPLGVLLRLTASRVTGRQGVQIVVSVALIASLSWCIESTQSLIPGRYAATQDILANSFGGAVGVLLGHRVNTAWRAGAFQLLRTTARPMGALKHRMQSPRAKPLVMFAAFAINVGLITLWYTLSATGASGTHAGTAGIQWVPFREAFDRSYDVAALLLGKSLIVYCLAGSVWMLTLMRGRTRRALGLVVLTAALTAGTVEAIKLIGPGRGADLTEPLLALIAGGLVLTAGFMLVHACRCSCRRVQQVAVEFDRRRSNHDYRFTIKADKTRA